MLDDASANSGQPERSALVPPVSALARFLTIRERNKANQAAFAPSESQSSTAAQRRRGFHICQRIPAARSDTLPATRASLRMEPSSARRSPISYQWVVRITDNGGSSSPSWSGNLAYRRTWVTNGGNFLVYKLTRGTAWARVDSDWSYALLANGAICSSAGPATSTNIY